MLKSQQSILNSPVEKYLHIFIHNLLHNLLYVVQGNLIKQLRSPIVALKILSCFYFSIENDSTKLLLCEEIIIQRTPRQNYRQKSIIEV